MTSRHPALEGTFVVISLVLLSGGFLPLVIEGSDTEAAFLGYVWLFIYIVVSFLLIPYKKRLLTLVIKEKFALSLLVLAAASVTWSSFPFVTTTHCISLLGTTLFGIYLAVRYSLDEQMRLLAAFLGVIIFSCFVMGIFFPQYGVSTDVHEGAWRGVFFHKNSLGRMMTLSCIVFSSISDCRLRQIKLFGVTLSIILVFLSNSISSLTILLLLLFFSILIRLSKQNHFLKMSVLIAAGTLFLLLLHAVPVNSLLDLIGRDASMSGRDTLWGEILLRIYRHPILGYGYSAFWVEGNNAVAQISSKLGWEVPHSHNGLLDLCLDLGIVGVVLFILGFFRSYFSALSTAMMRGVLSWPLLYLTFMFLSNLSESAILKQNSLFWVIYVSVVFTNMISSSECIPRTRPLGTK